MNFEGSADSALPNQIAETDQDTSIMASLVNAVESAFKKSSTYKTGIETNPRGIPYAVMERVPGGRGSTCEFLASMVIYATERMGLQSSMFQIRDIQQLRGVPADHTFNHLFVVINGEKNQTLLDLTFGQFIDPTTGEIGGKVEWPGRGIQEKIYTGINLSESPVAQELLDKGFVTLTEHSFAEYLSITSTQSCVPTQEIFDLFKQVKPVPIENGYRRNCQKLFRGILPPKQAVKSKK